MIKKLSFLLALLIGLQLQTKAQTTYTVTFPSTGNNVINVTCAVGDIILFQAAAQPWAIQIFRNPSPNYTVTPTGTSTAYTVTATDTSYSSIVSLSPVSTCTGKINITGTTSVQTVSQSAISIYPNPVGNELFFAGVTQEEIVTISDLTGRQIRQISLSPATNRMDFSLYSSGVYFVRVGSKTYKLVKE